MSKQVRWPLSHSDTRRVRLALWMVCLAALSVVPLWVKRAIGANGVLHNAGHLAAFAVTGILFLQCKRPDRFQGWLLWPLVAFAFALEWAEAVLFRNVFEWRDVGIDTLGLLTALLAYSLYDHVIGR
jgi:hypothetical protein